MPGLLSILGVRDPNKKSDKRKKKRLALLRKRTSQKQQKKSQDRDEAETETKQSVLTKPPTIAPVISNEAAEERQPQNDSGPFKPPLEPVAAPQHRAQQPGEGDGPDQMQNTMLRFKKQLSTKQLSQKILLDPIEKSSKQKDAPTTLDGVESRPMSVVIVKHDDAKGSDSAHQEPVEAKKSEVRQKDPVDVTGGLEDTDVNTKEEKKPESISTEDVSDQENVSKTAQELDPRGENKTKEKAHGDYEALGNDQDSPALADDGETPIQNDEEEAVLGSSAVITPVEKEPEEFDDEDKENVEVPSPAEQPSEVEDRPLTALEKAMNARAAFEARLAETKARIDGFEAKLKQKEEEKKRSEVAVAETEAENQAADAAPPKAEEPPKELTAKEAFAARLAAAKARVDDVEAKRAQELKIKAKHAKNKEKAAAKKEDGVDTEDDEKEEEADKNMTAEEAFAARLAETKTVATAGSVLQSGEDDDRMKRIQDFEAKLADEKEKAEEEKQQAAEVFFSRLEAEKQRESTEDEDGMDGDIGEIFAQRLAQEKQTAERDEAISALKRDMNLTPEEAAAKFEELNQKAQSLATSVAAERELDSQPKSKGEALVEKKKLLLLGTSSRPSMEAAHGRRNSGLGKAARRMSEDVAIMQRLERRKAGQVRSASERLFTSLQIETGASDTDKAFKSLSMSEPNFEFDYATIERRSPLTFESLAEKEHPSSNSRRSVQLLSISESGLPCGVLVRTGSEDSAPGATDESLEGTDSSSNDFFAEAVSRAITLPIKTKPPSPKESEELRRIKLSRSEMSEDEISTYYGDEATQVFEIEEKKRHSDEPSYFETALLLTIGATASATASATATTVFVGSHVANYGAKAAVVGAKGAMWVGGKVVKCSVTTAKAINEAIEKRRLAAEAERNKPTKINGAVLLMLVSGDESNKEETELNDSALLMLRGAGIVPEMIDLADPMNADIRDDFVQLFGVAGNYPQFFLRGKRHVSAVGGFDEIANYSGFGTLQQEIFGVPGVKFDNATEKGDGRGERSVQSRGIGSGTSEKVTTLMKGQIDKSTQKIVFLE